MCGYGDIATGWGLGYDGAAVDKLHGHLGARTCHAIATDVGVLLICERATAAHNDAMMERETFRTRPAPKLQSDVVTELRREVDARDETIRLLNEALSRALDELARESPPAAA